MQIMQLVLHKDEVLDPKTQKTPFEGYNIKWEPVLPGSDQFYLSAEPVVKPNTQ